MGSLVATYSALALSALTSAVFTGSASAAPAGVTSGSDTPGGNTAFTVPLSDLLSTTNSLETLVGQLLAQTRRSSKGGISRQSTTTGPIAKGATSGITIEGSASLTWTGNTSNDWGTATNWGGTVPGSNDTAYFSNISNGRITPTLAASYSVGSLFFRSAANAYTIGGANSLTLNSSGEAITQGSANLQTISVSSLVLGASQTWYVTGTGVLLVSSPISGGSFGLTKTGNSTLTLSGANTYSGGTTISAGTLQIGNGSTTGSVAGDITDNAALVFNLSGPATEGGIISGSGSLTKVGAGTLTLTGANTYTGTTIVNGGTLALHAPIGDSGNNYGGALQSDIIVNGAGATLSTLATDQTSNLSTITLGNGGSMNIVTGHTSFIGVNLTGNATVRGATTDPWGLYLYARASLTATGTGNNISAPLGLQNNVLTVTGVSDTLNISGVVSNGLGVGTFTKAGLGTLTLTGANTYSGGTTINAGTVVGSGGTISGTTVTNGALGTGAVTVAAGATLSVGQAVNTALTNRPGYGTLALSALTLTGGSTTPLLTFDLGPTGSANGSTNDLLNFSGSANSLLFSGSGTYDIGFASESGSKITGSPTYELMTFATPIALASATVADPNTKFTGIGTGNLQNPASGMFSWITSGGNITGLQYGFVSADVTPEPTALLLLAPGALAMLAARRRRGA